MGLQSEASTQADRLFGPSSTSGQTPSATDQQYQDCLFGEALATSTSTSAANVDLCLTSAATTRTDYLSAGGFWITVQPRGADVHIRFRPDNNAAATTTSNGILVTDGTIQHFWIAGGRQRYMDHKATASATLVWWRSSDPRRQT